MRLPSARPDSPGRADRQRPGLTSLVDVVFLLLMFFLLAGTLRVSGPFDVHTPEGDGARIAEATSVIVWLAADGRLALGDETTSLDELAERLSAEPGKIELVQLRADAGARALDLLPLLEMLRESHGRLALTFHAHGQGLQTTQQKPCIER